VVYDEDLRKREKEREGLGRGRVRREGIYVLER